MTTTVDGRPVFSRGAVVGWARSIGIPDSLALEFIRKEGVTIVEEDETVLGD